MFRDESVDIPLWDKVSVFESWKREKVSLRKEKEEKKEENEDNDGEDDRSSFSPLSSWLLAVFPSFHSNHKARVKSQLGHLLRSFSTLK